MTGVVWASALLAFAGVDRKAVGERFVKAFVEERYSVLVAASTSKMKEAMPEATWGATRSQLEGQVGALKGLQGEAWTAEQGPYLVVIQPLRFEKALLDAQVVVDGKGQLAGFFVKPHKNPPRARPEAQEPYGRRDITLGSGPLSVPGEVDLPSSGRGPFPCVVLAHGSGPNDRDETVGAQKPFLDLARGLTARGIAVLRYDKRTKVHPGAFGPGGRDARLEDVVMADALAALAAARSIPGVDTGRVFLLGHSLGGIAAPELARRDGKVAGIVLLSTPANDDLPALALFQSRYIAQLDGTVSPQETRALERLRAERRALEAGKPGTFLGAPNAFWREIANLDPVRRVKEQPHLPVLVMGGAKDYQVPPSHLAVWRTALKDHPGACVMEIPGVGHLLTPAGDPPGPADYQDEGHMAPVAVEVLATWMLEGVCPGGGI